jgi:hypothetical protein
MAQKQPPRGAHILDYLMKKMNLVGLAGVFAASTAIFLSPGFVQAEELFGVTTTGNQLVSFDSGTPGSVSSLFINGLQGGESIVGLDFWGTTLYGLGSSSRLYTIDTGTASVTEVGAFGDLLSGLAFGFDIDSSGARVIGSGGQQLLIDLNTGTSTLGSVVTSGVSGLAYDYDSGNHYVADYVANTIGTVDTGSGLVTVVGPAGIDFSRNNGFDISANVGNTAFLASPATSSGSEANLYTVNLTDGTASLVGLIGNPGDNILLQGLTALPIPEPSTAAFLLLGVGALLAVRRSRAQ